MKRSHDGVPVVGETSIPLEAKRIYESDKCLVEIDGHLRQRLQQNQELPFISDNRCFGKLAWLCPLLEKVEFTARGHLNRWNLIQLLIFAKHYIGMLIHWEAIGALIEIWHPQTHTFLFPTFEGSILIEEVELFLGLQCRRVGDDDDDDDVAHCMTSLDTMEFLSKLTGDHMQVKNIKSPNDIRLSRLAKWAMKAKDEGKSDEKIAQALSLCLARLPLFPHHQDILDQEHLGVVQSAWQGRSLAQPVLAFLYSGLSSACIGKPFYGSAILLDIWLSLHVQMDFRTSEPNDHLRTYMQTLIYRLRDASHFSETTVIRTLHLHTRADWRKFFVYMSRTAFTFSSEALAKLKLKTSPCQRVDLRLVGSKELVLYNAHRCYLQIGMPRQVIPQLSHYQPIEPRNFGTYHDQVDVRASIELWKTSCAHKPRMTFVNENVEELREYFLWLKELRSIKY